MISYEGICCMCKKRFVAVEGSLKYKLLKENKHGQHVCQPCTDRVRLEAILNTQGLASASEI